MSTITNKDDRIAMSEHREQDWHPHFVTPEEFEKMQEMRMLKKFVHNIKAGYKNMVRHSYQLFSEGLEGPMLPPE